MIGDKLGYPAHMSKLIRSRSASFTLEDAVSLDQLAVYAEEGTVNQILKPIEEGVRNLPSVVVSNEIAEKVQNGAVLTADNLSAGNMESPFSVFNDRQELLAIYQHHPEKNGLCKPVKVIPFI